MTTTFSVRRLAALDLHGANGTRARRRIITIEFFGAFALGLALGIILAVNNAPWPWIVLLIGDGLNYLPLAIHAARFLPGDRLDRELAGVEVRTELRRRGLSYLWLFVPGVVLALSFARGEWRAIPMTQGKR